MGPPSQRAGRDTCRPTPHPVAACPAPLIRSTGGGGNPSSTTEATGQHPHVPPAGFRPTPHHRQKGVHGAAGQLMSGHLPALGLSGPSRARGGPQPDTSLQLLPGRCAVLSRRRLGWPQMRWAPAGAGARLVRLPLGAEPFQVPFAPLLAGPSCGPGRGTASSSAN